MRDILNKLLNGELSIDEAEEQLRIMQTQEVGENIKFDTMREERVGVPEAVYSQGKTDADLVNIINNVQFSKQLMITRLPKDRFNRIKNQLNKDILEKGTYYEEASILTINKVEPKHHPGKVGIITAGTADVPVAEEARITLKQAGYDVVRTYDVGVAGIHRLIDKITVLLEEKVDVIITVAGMEGALPSVVAGLVNMPIIAVPTSTGYGVGEKGFLALFSMLQSCAPGIATMNIDNGYGAGIYAITIMKQIEKHVNEKY
ncbi:nickel pincer cofactor biosynthesis protein LarB [uncultured Methanosphaera sp.]|uniref:nickel pincer cofactor biosynthesis protein LarB n=1 Tax=uncultured Methanosphaera sp. TaxID=262501 RepID=UPI000DC3BEE7|nr:nickel pincer cofactor biosynthesis protein LarB [uncultured Methanosphaera sp.]RAP44027.1 MAG: hypothetical protein BZ134_04960 [Methanosphaera sp. SHI1033]